MLAGAISRLNEAAVISMASKITTDMFDVIGPQQRCLITESTGERIPILQSLDGIQPTLVHSSRACVVMDPRVVLVWSNDPNAIVNIAADVEMALLDLVIKFPAAAGNFSMQS